MASSDDELKEEIQGLIDKANRRRRDDRNGTGKTRAQGDVGGKTFVVRAGEDADTALRRWKGFWRR